MTPLKPGCREGLTFERTVRSYGGRTYRTFDRFDFNGFSNHQMYVLYVLFEGRKSSKRLGMISLFQVFPSTVYGLHESKVKDG